MTVAYVLAVGAGGAWLAVGPDTDHLWLDALLADFIATMVIFGFSRAYGNSSFYDAYWSVIPPLILLYWWAELGEWDDARTWLLMIVILLWAVRLTLNWVRTFAGMHHEDWRYPMLKERAGRFEFWIDLLGIHVFPTLQVFAALVPAYLVVSHDRDLRWLDVVAVVIGLGGVALELVSDRQMAAFIRDRSSGQVMDRGLWGWSRHPNYLGELMFWLSVALFGLSAAPDDWWWLFAGFAGMVAMFRFASIPMMEERSLERRPSYQEVIDRVPMLLPRPPRR